jgi:hypothetical protein
MRAARLRAAAIVLLAATPTLAHHGWSEYDSSQPLTVSGTIVEWGYSNPHTVIKLQTADKTWTAVLAPPHRMENRGLPTGSIDKGKTVTVVGHPHKRDPQEMRAERITIDGKTVELR